MMAELLMGLRAEIIQQGGSPASIVERINVEAQVSPCLVAGMIHAVVRPAVLIRVMDEAR